MPGYWITNQQVERYMKARTEGHTQPVSAAKSGMSERTGRDIDCGKRTNPHQKERHWRTHKDPLEEVWDSELVPMLTERPALQAITLLEYLQSKHPDCYEDKVLRTLQRRVKAWRATAGPEKEVMFRQRHDPGRQGLSDFTQLKQTTVTIAGCAFNHLLYHFRLAFSHWSYMKVIEGGESYAALAEGLQEALQRLGGAPLEHRTDSLSAAYRNLNRDAQVDVTARYQSFCGHYSMQATRNNPGESHENGSIEAAHGHLKRRIEQALLLRGSCDFESVQAYQAFIDEVVSQHNRRNAKAIGIERHALQPLPHEVAVDYTEVRAVVTSSSTIDVRRVTYTVPSRLKNETLHIRLYDDRLECYFGHQAVITLKRIYPVGKSNRARLIDYRHVIHSLVKKPQAFRYSQIRDDLLPTLSYQTIWTRINQSMQPKEACRFIVGLLHLAATEDCEDELAQAALEKLSDNMPLSLTQLQRRFRRTKVTEVPVIPIEHHVLSSYDQLLSNTVAEVCHA